jgi:hypothetical protein
MDDLPDVKLDAFVRDTFRKDIFRSDLSLHLFLVAVPVRHWPWKGFKSLRNFVVRWASDAIETAAAENFTKFVIKESSLACDILSGWKDLESRVLLGFLMEKLFDRFVRKVDIYGLMMEVIIFEMKSESGPKKFGVQKTNAKEWEMAALCKQMEVVVGAPKVTGTRDRYYRPESTNQRLYDAVVVPCDTSESIDIIQITLAGSHSVATEEFRNLFKIGLDRWFRFLMIRVAFNETDVGYMIQNRIQWCVRDLKSELDGFPERVTFYECIVNFKDLLMAYQRVLLNHG